jgi:predicted permease
MIGRAFIRQLGMRDDIGALLSRSQIIKIFTQWKIYYVTAMKLIVIPLVVCLISNIIGLSDELTLFFTASCAMPSATNVSMLAELYDISPEYSAQSVGITSVLSVLTIPTIMMIANFLLA